MRTFLLTCLATMTTAFAMSSEESWTILKNSPVFSLSAEFDCKRGEVTEAKVIRKGRFCPRYYYDLYDATGEKFLARGITRAFSLGFIFPWGMEIDVYDGNIVIGKIEGKLFTKARAKFIFYDGNKMQTAIAYLNTEASDFVIVTPQNEGVVIADLAGKAYGDVSVWQMSFGDVRLQVDPRMLQIFAAFVSDYHSEFLPPPKVENHYYFYSNTNTQN